MFINNSSKVHGQHNTSEMSLNKMIEENEEEHSEVNKNVSLEGKAPDTTSMLKCPVRSNSIEIKF